MFPSINVEPVSFVRGITYVRVMTTLKDGVRDRGQFFGIVRFNIELTLHVVAGLLRFDSHNKLRDCVKDLLPNILSKR